jgi:hypothetical protein
MIIFGYDFGWDALVAISTFLLAFGAIAAIYVEWKRCRFEHAIDLIVELDDHFNTTEFRIFRQNTAKFLLGTEQNQRSIDQVLGFFEKVGYLTRNGVIEEKMVWHEMFYWIHRYYLSATPFITRIRVIQKDNTVFEDFEYLQKRLVEIEKKERNCADANLTLSENELRDFLIRESEV